MRQFEMGSLRAAAATKDNQSDAAVQTQTSSMQTQGKPEWSPLGDMSIKKLGCNPLDAVRQEKTVYLCRIFGEATELKSKEGKSGDVYEYLIGDFRGVNAKGDKFESTKLFLPERLREEVQSSLKATGNPVEFGYDIFSTPDTTSSTGYKYACKAIIKTEASDRVTKLSQSVMAKPLPKTDGV